MCCYSLLWALTSFLCDFQLLFTLIVNIFFLVLAELLGLERRGTGFVSFSLQFMPRSCRSSRAHLTSRSC
jgi:hypothetical protein